MVNYFNQFKAINSAFLYIYIRIISLSIIDFCYSPRVIKVFNFNQKIIGIKVFNNYISSLIPFSTYNTTEVNS